MPPPSPRQDNIAMSLASGSPSSASLKSNAFSEGTKLQVRNLAGDECWACGTISPHICHVFAQEDQQAAIWSDLGLLDFPLSSPVNGIPLCPTCHGQFDNHLHPGLILIPTDLQFFIDYELCDRKRRKRAAENGITLKREVPSCKTYKAYQVEKGTIASNATGGLYRPVFLKPYLARRLQFDITKLLSEPRQWHGAPLACLRRCILVLGGAGVRVLDRKTRQELEQLRDLYFLEDDEDSPPPPSKYPDLLAAATPDNRDKKRQPSDVTLGGGPSAKRQRGAQQGGSTSDNRDTQEAKTFCPILQREVRAYWSLGPEVSTEEAVKQFAPLFRSSPATYS